jgi:hypothetical protein
VSNLLYLAIAAIFVLAVAGFILRGIIGSAIRDQRQAATAEAAAKIEAEAERKLKPLREKERRQLEKLQETRERAKNARNRLPVWGKASDGPNEEVLAYAKKRLTLDYDGRNMKVDGQWRIYDFVDAPSWMMGYTAIHYFYVTMAEHELAIARAALAYTKTESKIARLEGDIYHYSKGKRDAKRAVVFLESALAHRDWELKQHLNYCLILHDKGWMDYNNKHMEWIRDRHARKLAEELTGPRPAVVKTPRGFYPELSWDLDKKDGEPLTGSTTADAVTTANAMAS